MKRNTDLRLFYTSIAICILLAFAACKKEKELVNNDTSKFIFSVASLNKSSSNILANSSPENLDNNFNAVTSIANNVNILYGSKEKFGRIDELSDNLKNKIKSASTSVVHPYMRYRILLYNMTNNTLERSIEGDSRSILEIPVTSGDEYRWYAYSYNTAGNVEEPIIENNIPTIRTPTDKEFIWASSGASILASGATIPLSINFEHKVAEVILEIDTKNLYGTITDVEIAFAELDYFNTAKINLFDGTVTDVMDYPSPILDENSFTPVDGDPLKFQVRIYTAVPDGNIENLIININKLSIINSNGQVRKIHTPENLAKQIPFSFNTPNVSKSHVASLDLRYLLKTKRVLHVTGVQNNYDQQYAYAAQPVSRDLLYDRWSTIANDNRPPFNMIKEPKNFGELANSVVYTEGFTHVRCLDDGSLDQKLTAAGNLPDIVIMAIYYKLDTDDIVALNNYLDQGGVVIMMTDSQVPAEAVEVQNFMNTLFGTTNIALNAISSYATSTMFELRRDLFRDGIIEGAFGNLQGNYWGSDGSTVILANNIPLGIGPNQATYYSDNSPANRAVTGNGIPMFRHNTKNFFWIGDGSFLATPSNTSKGWSVTWSNQPFATVNLSNNPPQFNSNSAFNYDHYPMSKRYGIDYAANEAGYNYFSHVYNAPFFANLLAWAVYQSDFNGINTGGLKGIDVVDWIINTDKEYWNIDNN